MKKDIKIVCYARFGNSSQLEAEQKKTELKNYADKNRYTIKDIIIEQHSGIQPPTENLNRVLSQKGIDAILTPNIHCLSRDMRTMFDIISKAKRSGKEIISIDKNIMARS